VSSNPVAGTVERRRALSREAFVLEFERKRPVVVEGGGGAALARWDPEYLSATAGGAELELLEGVYSTRARGEAFARARKRTQTLAEYIRALLRGESDPGYLFNTESGVLLTNPAAAEFQVGWGKSANPGLAPLAADFVVPGFLRPESLIYAALILGGPAQAAPLHYDLGGEAKALVQLCGKKRVRLFAPSEAAFLSFPSWFEEAPAAFRVPHAAEVDLDRPEPERFPEFARAEALEAELGPGDVLYWPSFWAHHIRNQDAFTLAVSVTVEELHANAMQLRETLGILSRLFLRMAGEPSRGFDLTNRAGVLAALRALEAELFSEENRKRTSMWSWHNSIWHE